MIIFHVIFNFRLLLSNPSQIFNTLHNVCAVHWGVCCKTGDVQYTGGYHESMGDIMSTQRDIMSTLGGYHEYTGGIS